MVEDAFWLRPDFMDEERICILLRRLKREEKVLIDHQHVSVDLFGTKKL